VSNWISDNKWRIDWQFSIFEVGLPASSCVGPPVPLTIRTGALRPCEESDRLHVVLFSSMRQQWMSSTALHPYECYSLVYQ